MPVRTKTVHAGSWRTLETYWNVTTTAFFLLPERAEIKIRYSGFWFGVDRQRQTLDGVTIKKLNVSRWSLFTARIQMKVVTDATVTYYVEAGFLANLPPGIDL